MNEFWGTVMAISIVVAVLALGVVIFGISNNNNHVISNCTYVSTPNAQWDCSLTNISAQCQNTQVQGLSNCNATQIGIIKKNTTIFIAN